MVLTMEVSAVYMSYGQLYFLDLTKQFDNDSIFFGFETPFFVNGIYK